MLGVVFGLGAAVAGQVAPILFKHAESLRSLRWTPPGAAAFLLVAMRRTTGLLTLRLFDSECLCDCVDRGDVLDCASLGARNRREEKTESVVESADTGGYSGGNCHLLSKICPRWSRKSFATDA